MKKSISMILRSFWSLLLCFRNIIFQELAPRLIISVSRDVQRFDDISNRCVVARAVLQSLSLLISWFSEWVFSAKPSKHHYTQIVRARELKFWENVHPPSVTCQVSGVRCQVSCVMCFFLPCFFDKVMELVGGVSVINGAYTVSLTEDKDSHQQLKHL